VAFLVSALKYSVLEGSPAGRLLQFDFRPAPFSVVTNCLFLWFESGLSLRYLRSCIRAKQLFINEVSKYEKSAVNFG
jgi:hypothetical protein